MRQIIAYVKEGHGEEALRMAQSEEGTGLARFPADGPQEKSEIVLIQTSNDRLEALIGKLQTLEDLRLTVFPVGIISLRPPQEEAAEQATDVTLRSPIEVFLNGLQSIGSWRGFLGYSLAAGIVVWTGLYTNTVYLLVAAMLIAPFAGPAMNMALGTARGDKKLILHSLGRYFSSLIVCILSTAILSKLFGQRIATELMVSNSLVSSVAMLLPLTAGAAGAWNLCQSDNNSLVTAAGAGMLVAASLAPPAGLIGMAGAIGEWDMVKSGAFVLILQLVGINFSGALIFAFFGLKPQGVRYERGQNWLRWTSWISTIVLLGFLTLWQFNNKPNLQRSSLSRRISADVKEMINQSGMAKPVEVNVRFTRADIKGQNTLLVNVFVQKDAEMDDGILKRELITKIREEIKSRKDNVTPLINVVLLEK
jgi:uncharacterized hydrophobic protein (TIGR00271 family)